MHEILHRLFEKAKTRVSPAESEEIIVRRILAAVPQTGFRSEDEVRQAMLTGSKNPDLVEFHFRELIRKKRVLRRHGQSIGRNAQ